MDGRRQNPDGDSVFSKSLNVNFNDDKVKFDNRNLDNPNDNYGSVSGFLPKSPLRNMMNVRLYGGHLLSFF